MEWLFIMKYNDENRGIIQNRKYAKQINNFSGLRVKNITPTDIDGFIDFGNKKFVFIEMKYRGAKLPYGQRLALERLIDSCNKDAVLIIAQHDTESGDIDVANSIVREYRYKKKWTTQFKVITVYDAVLKFLEK